MRCATRLLLGMLLSSGTATARADLDRSPWELQFGYQAVNTTSGPMATTLKNTGKQTLSITAVTAATGVYARAGGSCGTTPFTLTPQATCTIAHMFTPTAIQAFYQTITVTLADGSTVAFGLAGQGQVGYLEITPQNLSYSPTPVGAVSDERTAQLLNNRPVSMLVTQLALVSTPAVSAFVRTGGTCPSEVPFTFGAMASCTLAYRFMPDQVGSSMADVYIVGSGTFTLPLRGEGLPEIPLFATGFEAPAPVPAPIQ